MTAKETLDKYLLKEVTPLQEMMILAAMEEYGKEVHRNTRHKAIDIILECQSEDSMKFADHEVRNMSFEDIEPK